EEHEEHVWCWGASATPKCRSPCSSCSSYSSVFLRHPALLISQCFSNSQLVQFPHSLCCSSCSLCSCVFLLPIAHSSAKYHDTLSFIAPACPVTFGAVLHGFS